MIPAEPLPIDVGDRVRSGRAVGLVLHRDEACARVAFEGALPREVPIADLERVTARKEGVNAHVPS